MFQQEISEFDDKGLMDLPIPSRFICHDTFDKDTFSLERVPITTSQGDYDAFLYGIYTAEEGNRAQLAIQKMTRQLFDELSTAELNGIFNDELLHISTNLLTTVGKKPEELLTYEALLKGEIGHHDFDPNKPQIWIQVSKPPGIDNRNVGASLLLHPTKPSSFNFAVMSLCSHRSNSKNLIEGLFNTSRFFTNDKGSMIKQISGDIMKCKLATLF